MWKNLRILWRFVYFFANIRRYSVFLMDYMLHNSVPNRNFGPNVFIITSDVTNVIEWSFLMISGNSNCFDSPDHGKDCGKWKEQGFCESKDPKMMSDAHYVCRKTCNLCNGKLNTLAGLYGEKIVHIVLNKAPNLAQRFLGTKQPHPPKITIFMVSFPSNSRIWCC